MLYVMNNRLTILTILFIAISFIIAVNGNADFADGSQNYISLTPTITSSSVNLTFTNGAPSSTTATLYTGSNSSNVNLSKTVSGNAVAFSTSDFTSNTLDYGVYEIMLQFNDGGGSYSLKTAVVYELPISGFHVVVDPIVHIHDNITFTAKFTEASNVEIEWHWNMAKRESELDDHSGSLTEITKYHTFNETTTNNITVTVANPLNRVYQFVTVKVQHPVNNFMIESEPGPHPTGINIPIKVNLSVSALLPMGTLKLNVSYGDDTGNDIVDLTSSILSQMQAGTYTIQHSYSKQGNFSGTVKIQSEISHQEFVFERYIWDDISSLSLKVAEGAAKSSVVPFTFLNTPPNGFFYRIQTGDGAQYENTPEFVYSQYSDPATSHVYTDIGIYTVEMIAWNPFYASNCTHTIIIQVPVEDLVLFPQQSNPPIMYPIPDGIVEFKYEMTADHEDPTNVTCINIDGPVETNLTYGVPIMYTYTYSNPGIFIVNITCYNFISSVEMLTEIEMLDATLDKFSLVYPAVVGMNMTKIESSDPSVDAIFEYEHKTVIFYLILQRCVKFPPVVNIDYNFGDDSSNEFRPDVQLGTNISHTYTQRGRFSITLHITDNSSRSAELVFPIKTGATDLVIDRYAGEIGQATFSFTVSGLGSGATYVLEIGEGVIKTLTDINNKFSHVYTSYEKFNARVEASNSTFYEISYSTIAHRAEKVITGVTISLPEKVDLPPGRVVVNTSLGVKSAPLAFINCTFEMGDLIDRKIYHIYQNLTVQMPIVFDFTYITLGNHTVKVNCSNSVSFYSKNITMNVWNECYQPTGIFDRDYSNETNPLVLYTSFDTDLGSRMAVYCTDQHVQYIWNFYTINDNGTYDVPYNYVPIVPPTGIIRFAKGTIDEGIYKVTLNVSLDRTWVYEPTFIKFVTPPPFAFIQGGSLRSIKLIKNFVEFDAFSVSYDLMYGEGANQNLTFMWSCRQFSTSDLQQLSSSYETVAGVPGQLDTLPDCMPNLEPKPDTNNGSLIMNLTIQAGYAVTVTVFLNGLNTSYTQLVQATEGQAPDVGIRCKLNCDDKYAYKLKSIYEAECYDCDPGEINYVTFRWKLHKSGVLLSDAEFRSITLTGIDEPTIALKENSLVENTNYKLWLYAKGGWGRTDQEAMRAIAFRTNLAPYNGACKASPAEGNASTTPFAIHCSGYIDEGGNPERDPIQDEIARNPLKYTYYTVDKYNNGVNTTIVKSVIFNGAEMSATEILLPLGDPDSGYRITLMVDISDRFGDYVSTEMVVKVLPDVKLQPQNGDDIQAVDNLFEAFDKTYNITAHGGNAMSVVRLVGATASMYSHINVKQKSSVITTDSAAVTQSATNIDSNPFIDPTVDITSDSNAQIILKEKNKILSDIVNNSIPNPSSDAPLLAGDAQLVASSLNKVLLNTDVVTPKISVSAYKSADSLMQNIQRSTLKKPFPMNELNSILSSTSEVMTSIDSNLDFIFDENDEDLSQPLTIEAVRQELTTMYNTYRKKLYEIEVGSDANFESLVQRVYIQRSAKRNKQSERVSVSQQSSGDLFNTIDTALNLTGNLVQYGEEAYVMTKRNVLLSVEKDSIDNFVNMGKLERKNVSLSTLNLTKSNDSAASVEIQVSVFEKSPVPHAQGDNKISSKCVLISTSDHNKNNIELDREVTIPSSSSVHYNTYATSLDPEDPDQMMYFAFEVKDTDDVSITYVRYDDGEFPDIDIIYTAYFRSGDYPSSTEYDYKYDVTINNLDPNENVLKIIAPARTFQPGKAYLALQPKQYSSDVTPPARRKRGASNTNVVNPMNANFSTVTATTGCRSYDATTGKWETNGCIVLPFSTLNETVCRCPSNTKMIATTFFATPNTIDFDKVWGQFQAENAAVYGTLIALVVLFIILAVLLRRKDKADMLKWSVRFLCDCDSEDKYFYIISVHTGLRPGAGTDSNVNFVLAGEAGDTGVRCLSDGIEHGFETASVRNFVMSTNVMLGQLTYFRLWHDNSGGDRSSWYLKKVIIDDPQTNRRYVFNCDKWLSLDFDDGMIERILPVLDASNLDIENMFFQRSQTDFTENHLWLSLFVRPTRTVFTRVQRLGCGMTLLLLTMISNAMFFKTSDEDTIQADAVRVGFLRISLTNLYISFIGILITTPPIFFASYVFRNCEPKNKRRHCAEKNNCCVCCFKQKRHRQDKEKQIKGDEFLINKSRKFPNCVVNVAWVILFLASATSAFFLLLYSMQWGKDKSEEWLSTFILSFIESFVFVDPIKVLVIALLLTIIFRKHVDDETTLVDMTKLRQAASKNCTGNSRLFWAFRHEVLSKCEPPAEDKLNEQRQRRRQELKAKAVFREVVLHIIFAIIVYLISYINRDTRAYLLKQNIDNFIYASSKSQYGFSKINSARGMMEWLDSTFVPAFYPVQEYNGKSLSLQDKFYINDLTNVRLGVIRLRQVRMPKEKCKYWKITGKRFCTSNFQSGREESGEYCASWKDKSSGCPPAEDGLLTKGAYKYKTASELSGMPFAGEYDVYSAGGFVQDLPNNRDTVNSILNELKMLKWIDRQTRAIFTEFTLYNSNLNLVTYCTFAVEFTDAGIAVYHTFTQSFRPSLLNDATGALSLIFYFIYIIILIISTCKTVGKLRKHGCEFFKALWNVIDVLTCIMSYTAIGVWVVKYFYTKNALKRYYDDKSAFINFSDIVSWEYTFNCIVGFIVFTATLRILKTLGYNKRCSELVAVIRHAAPELLSFVVIFGLAFFGFAILGFLLFGASMYDYHNLIATLGSLANTLIGRNSLDQMVGAAPLFAQFYFFIYVLFVIFVLLTMFAAILNQSITDVREEYKKEETPIGILNLITATVKDLLGMFGIHIRSNNKQQKIEKKYAVKMSQNAQIDTPNVLQLVRDTFGNLADDPNDKEKLAEMEILKLNQNVDEVREEDQQYLIVPRSRSRLSGTRTPRDIDLRLSPMPGYNATFSHNTYL